MKRTLEFKQPFMEEEVSSHDHKSQVNYLLDEIASLKEKLENQADVIMDLKRQAMEDTLTGLANRRAFEKELKRSLSFFKRHRSSGALLLIDLDGFKSINDSLGHLAGDALLKHISKLLTQHIRSSDFVARLGGDEFCVILNAIDSKLMKAKAEEIAEVISSTPCRYEGRDIYASASVGVCSFKNALNAEELIEKADAAMYRHKSQGSPKIA